MGKGKKERAKKNRNKKETREPIKRMFEGKKYCYQTHQMSGIDLQYMTRRTKNKIELSLAREDDIIKQIK